MQIGADTDWASVAAGDHHSLARKADGSLYAWGKNTSGQVGNDSFVSKVKDPVLINAENFISIAAGSEHSLAVQSNGSLFAWGSNTFGMLGLGTDLSPKRVPELVNTDTDWVTVAAAGNSSLATREDSTLWGWGSNSAGQLGLIATTANQFLPVQVGTNSADTTAGWVAITVGGAHALGIVDDGGDMKLYGWGENISGQLGIGNNARQAIPLRVGSAVDWALVAAGGAHTLAINDSNQLFTTGSNEGGQLATGGLVDLNTLTLASFGVPDLIVQRVTLPEVTPAPNENLVIDVEITNQGAGTIGAGAGIVVEVRLSLDPLFAIDEDLGDPTENLTTFTVNDGIGSADSITIEDVSFPLPANIAQGSYFVVVSLDTTDQVIEIEEGNNDGASAETLEFFPDLQVTIDAIDLGPDNEINQGESFDVTLTISNQGLGDIAPGDAGSFVVRVVISEDQQTGVGDIEDLVVGEFTVNSGLARGAVVPAGSLPVPPGFTIPVSAPVGNRHLGVILDTADTTTETDEENNIVFSATPEIVVTGKSLDEALDDPTLNPIGITPAEDPGMLDFTSGDDSSWFGQEADFAPPLPADNPLNDDAAQSPPLLPGQSSFIETVVDGPTKIIFDWMISSNQRPLNTLVVTVDGVEPPGLSRISGVADWDRVEVLLPGETNNVRWTFFANEGEGNDFARLDQVQLEDVVGPDLFIQSVGFGADEGPVTLVLQQDPLTVTVLGRNQGEATDSPLPEDFRISLLLSPDATVDDDDNIFIGDLTQLLDLDADAQFIYDAVRDLEPTELRDIPSGSYHLIVVLDSKDRIQFNAGTGTDTVVDGDGAVVEFNEGNNVFISDSPDIIIERRADLISVVDSLSFLPRFYNFGETLEVDFTISNIGLADVVDPFKVALVLSDDRDFGSADDFVLTEVSVTTGLPIGLSDNFVVSKEITEGTPIGEFLWLGVIVDSQGDIPESRVDNNVLGSDTQELIFSEMPLGRAVDLVDDDDPDAGSAGSGSIINSKVGPFFGQTAETFDQIDAAQSAAILDDQTASFETTVIVEGNPTVVTYRWRVSSERDVFVGGTIKEDFLSFSIDDEEQSRISGIVDWKAESFVLTPGTHNLRWAYVKDGSDFEGDDAGWVDDITTVVPDIAVTSLDFPGAAGALPGNPINDPALIRITNTGAANIPETPPFTVELIMTPDEDLDDGNDFILETLTLNDGLTPGEFIDLSINFSVPSNIAFEGAYFLAARVDGQNLIPESDEGNNVLFTLTANLDVTLDTSLQEALNYPVPPLAIDPWDSFGAGVWFPQGTVSRVDGSAAQAPSVTANEEATLEIEIQGPAQLTYNWKVSSEPTANFLAFRINGLEKNRISGEQDFTEEVEFIPSGPQQVSWVYEKTVAIATGNDTGWVDEVSVTQVTTPDLIIDDLTIVDGVYILDRGDDPDRDKLPVELVVSNRGALATTFPNFSNADVQIRLSTNRTWGDPDDIVLGDFADISVVESGQRLIYSGPITLPLDTPEGDYFVAAFVDFFDTIEEFEETDPGFVRFSAEDNNLRFSPNRSITIRRLPDLVLEPTIAFDFDKVYFPESPIALNYQIRNRGLGDTSATQTFNVSVDIRSTIVAGTPANVGTVFDVDSLNLLAAQIPIKVLTSFSQSVFLPGVSQTNPNGSTIDFVNELTLPTEDEIIAVIPGDDIELRFYFLVVTVDTNNAVEESDEDNEFIPLVGIAIKFPPSSGENFEDFLARYGLDAIDAEVRDTDLDGLTDLEEYAIDTNPRVADASGTGLLNEFGLTVEPEDGLEYLRLTFDLNIFATDLIYTLEVSDTAGAAALFTPLIIIEPPYLDDHGVQSLTGVDGLNKDPLVTGVTPRGYSARISVRDITPIALLPQRFMRLRVESD